MVKVAAFVPPFSITAALGAVPSVVVRPVSVALKELRLNLPVAPAPKLKALAVPGALSAPRARLPLPLRDIPPIKVFEVLSATVPPLTVKPPEKSFD